MFAIKVNDQYPFEFETVQVDEQGQAIERKRGRAFAFREPLADETELEMVAIPSGKFMMGSPESEPNRNEDESPQHQVTIQPFFLGKYPVTQAQWLAIANTLPVGRELGLESPGFEGDNLPREHGNVSEWCLDCWHGDYRSAPADGSAWISGDDNVVIRGGSFDNFPAYCRSASRQLESPERYSRYCTNGFRVVCEIPITP
jgi:formylglycine-generating enzyme required for sulfatase activity